MATVREEAIKTVSESRTTLLTSRVRRQRYTTLLAAPSMASAIVIVVIGTRGPSSSSRAIIIIRIMWITIASWKLEHTARADISGRVYVMAPVIDDSSFLTSLFLRENCDAESQWKWCYERPLHYFFLFMPTRTMTWSYVVESAGILWMI